MSRLISVVALLLCLSGAALGPAVARGAQDGLGVLPEGPGGTLVATQCATCHSLDEALSKRTTADRWGDTVQEMIDFGAPITAPDAAAISSYLGQYFGLDAPVASQASDQASPLPDGEGLEVLTQKCFQCHQMGMWSAIRQDRQAWESVIYRMVGRGALWTEDEVDAMASYLARARGPLPEGQR